MMYSIVCGDRIDFGPVDYDQNRFAEIVKSRGGDPSLLPPRAPTGPVDCGSVTVLQAVDRQSRPPHVVGYTARLMLWAISADGQRLERYREYDPADFGVYCDQVREHVERQQEHALARIESGYTEREIKTWAQQRSESERWLLDNTASVPLLQTMAARRGIAVSDLVDKIQQKVAAAATASGVILGDAQAAADSVSALETLNTESQLPADWRDRLLNIATDWRKDWPPELL